MASPMCCVVGSTWVLIWLCAWQTQPKLQSFVEPICFVDFIFKMICFFLCWILNFFFSQIHLSLVQDRPATKANHTSTELLDFTLARFVRMRFEGMHTTSHSSNSIQWLVERTELNKRSFYSLRFIKIGARLDCGGHANEAKNFNSEDVIECNCAHNTCGVNCEKCCPLYNQRPYKAATYTDTNRCEQCEVCAHQPSSSSFISSGFFLFWACCISKCARSRLAKHIYISILTIFTVLWSRNRMLLQSGSGSTWSEHQHRRHL